MQVVEEIYISFNSCEHFAIRLFLTIQQFFSFFRMSSGIINMYQNFVCLMYSSTGTPLQKIGPFYVLYFIFYSIVTLKI